MSYRYIGNKTKLFPLVLKAINQLAPPGATVVDLMAGTASVAEGLRVAGYRVIASDLMTYSVHHARVRLLMSRAPAFKKLMLGGYAGVLDHLNTLKARKGLFYREYSPLGKPKNGAPARKYLTAENAGLLDAMSDTVSGWKSAGKISDNENSLLRHDLVLALNRVANIAGTYGHFRSSWSNGATNRLKLQQSDFLHGYSTDHEVLQGAAEEVSHRITADVCYIDPPYMKRQYAANYHLIETLARGDEPEAIGLSGLRPWRDQYSNFCTKTRIHDSFRRVFGEMNCDKFIMSYSEDGLLSKKQLIDLLSEFGRSEVNEIEFNRFRSNQSELGPTLKEYLFTMVRHKRPKKQR